MLRELQRDLARAFHAPDADDPAVSRVLARLRPVGGASPARTLEVYRGALRHVVERALGRIFPVCHALVGDDCFRGIARHHAARHVSREPDLGRIGDDLPALLPTLRFLDDVPYLADVARVELAVHRAGEAPEPERVDDARAAARLGAALAEAPEAWRLVLAPSASLIESPHPVGAIWAAHQPGADDPARFAIAPAAAPDRLIVLRRAGGIRVEAVPEPLWPLLVAVEAGAPVSELLERAAAGGAAGPDAAVAAIGRLFAGGSVTGVAPIDVGAAIPSSGGRNPATPVVEREEQRRP